VGDVTVSLAANPGGGSLLGRTLDNVGPADGGIAQWDNLSIDTPANGYVLRATAAGMGDALSDPFDITAGPPPPLNGVTGLGYLGSQPATVRAGAVLPTLQVEVLGYGGVRITGYTGGIWISLDANPGGATLSGTRRVVPVNGVATFSDLRVDTPGHGYTLRATIGAGVSPATSSPFDITP